MANFLQPPRLRIGEDTEEERRATWLELFYDLVFVVAVSQLAHNLNEDISLSGLFGFVVLFITVWWSWIGTTFYANRFDSDDVGHRLLIGIQMTTRYAIGFAIAHLWFSSIMLSSCQYSPQSWGDPLLQNPFPVSTWGCSCAASDRHLRQRFVTCCSHCPCRCSFCWASSSRFVSESSHYSLG